jgi:hypothetical protein
MDNIESVRFEVVQGDAVPPPKPPFFDHRYELPSHRVKLLETRNAHPRDARIVFYEEPHIYTVDHFPVQASVSGLAAEFESEFDPEEALQCMKRSRKIRWPRLQYVTNPQKVDDLSSLNGLSHGAMIVDKENDETISSTEVGIDAEDIVLYMILKDAAIRTIPYEQEEWYIYDRVMTDEEIYRKWELNGEDARNRGTEAHLQMELWFNSEPVRLDDAEVQVGLNFVRKCLLPIGAKAFRTEWTIFGEEENVAGCIDLAVTLPSGDVFLVDWKRSEKLAKKMYGYSRMKSPLSHLDDCSGSAYAIQLSSYQYIIEKYYNLKVVGRALASIHPDNPFTTAVPYLKEEVEYIMSRRRAMAETRKKLSKMEEAKHLLCSKSSMMVMDATEDVHGNLYDAKMAKLHSINVTPNYALTKEAMALLQEHMPIIYIAPNLSSWKKRFPSPTDDLLFFS